MKAFIKSACPAFASLLAALAFFSVPLAASTGAAEASSLPEGAESAASQVAEDAADVDESTSIAATDNTVTGFFVHARIPENQVNTRLSYFSLLMQPAQRQTLEVEIVNEGDEEIQVEVQAIAASTNINGIIDYKTPGIRDETLEYPFDELAEVQEELVTVPGKGTAVAAVALTMPEAEYDGIVLGGLVFTKLVPELDSDASLAGGAMIQNIYSYVLGVVLQETDAEVLPDFELAGMEPGLYGNQPSYIHGIRNTQAAVVKGMEVDVAIYTGDDAEGEPVAQRTQGNVDMAPNSVLEFAVTPEGEALRGGTYTSEVVLRLEEDEWRFTQQFTVDAQAAESVNDAAPGAEAGTPWVTILLVIIAGLVLGLVVLAILLLARRSKKPKS